MEAQDAVSCWQFTISLSLWFHWASVETRHLTIVTDDDVTSNDWWYHFSSEFTFSSQWSRWSWITRPLFMIGLSVLLTHVLTAQKLAKYWLGQAGRTPAPALGPAEARAAVQRSSLRMRDIHLALRGSEQSEARVSLVTTQLWQGGSPTRGCRPPKIDYYGTEISPVDNVNIYT